MTITTEIEAKRDQYERDALIMANARRLIKAHKITSNQALYMNLFGTGFGTARLACKNLIGCDPDSNVTSYNQMMEFIENRYRVRGGCEE